MITLQNLTKRTVVLNLTHAYACSPTECTCDRMKVGVQEHDKITGDRRVRAQTQRVPASITLFPKGHREHKPVAVADGESPKVEVVELDRVTDLLDNVQRLPEVKAMVDRGELKIIVQKPEPEAAAPPGPGGGGGGGGEPTKTTTGSAPSAPTKTDGTKTEGQRS